MKRVLQLLFGEFRLSWWRTVYQFAHGRRILVGRAFRVHGTPRLEGLGASLSLGTLAYGFASGSDRGVVRVRGVMTVMGRTAIGTGARLDVGPRAHLVIGAGTYLSPNVRIVLSRGLVFGKGCAVGWDVQILDDDFHEFQSSGAKRRSRAAAITIGDHVWIGSGAKVFKGVEIADGCVVAGGAVVTRSVLEPGTLIAGNPARAVRSGVTWE